MVSTIIIVPADSINLKEKTINKRIKRTFDVSLNKRIAFIHFCEKNLNPLAKKKFINLIIFLGHLEFCCGIL